MQVNDQKPTYSERQTLFQVLLSGAAQTRDGEERSYNRFTTSLYGSYRLDAVRSIMINLNLSYIDQVYITGGRQGFWFTGVSLDWHRNLNYIKCVEGVLSEHRRSERANT
jgi:hypothetical protein